MYEVVAVYPEDHEPVRTSTDYPTLKEARSAASGITGAEVTIYDRMTGNRVGDDVPSEAEDEGTEAAPPVADPVDFGENPAS